MSIPSELEATFRAVPALAGLKGRDLEKIWHLGSVQNLAAGTTLTMAGRAGLEVYLLLEGAAEVRLAGGETVVLGPGDFIGEMAALDDTRRSATSHVTEPGRSLVFSHANFQKAIEDHPEVLLHITRQLSQRLRERS